MKLKEKYEAKLKEVLKKLPKKYYEFTKLFVKKEYWLPRHDKIFEVKINLKPGFEPPTVKQFHKSPAELKIKDKAKTYLNFPGPGPGLQVSLSCYLVPVLSWLEGEGVHPCLLPKTPADRASEPGVWTPPFSSSPNRI